MTSASLWVQGARPRTLGAAVAPVLVGTAAAVADADGVLWWRAALAMVVALALRMIKASCNAADDGLAGIQQLAGDATLLFYLSEEAQEGRDAYVQKRAPDFSKFPKRP